MSLLNATNATAVEGCDLDVSLSLAIPLAATGGAFVLYIFGYYIHFCRHKNHRTQEVFWMDFFKISIAWAAAYGVASAVAPPPPESLDPFSWAFTTYLVDRVVGVPAALLVGKLVTLLFRTLGTRGGLEKWTASLHEFGQYSPGEDSQRLLGVSASRSSPLITWWFVQLVIWVGLIVGASVGVCIAVPSFEASMDGASPFHALAAYIYDLAWPCSKKLTVLLGAVRAIIDLLIFLLIDTVNKSRSASASGRRAGYSGGGSAPLLVLGSRVRALWKYTAQYEDELSFEAGEVIQIEGEVPGEELWFRGRIGNRTGLIPSNYVVEEGSQQR